MIRKLQKIEIKLTAEIAAYVLCKIKAIYQTVEMSIYLYYMSNF